MNNIISIIVPVYNTGNLLPRCLNSISNQTYKDIEIIVIDDGSTDNSKDIIKSFAIKDSRIKYYCQNNKGVGAARNKGIELSTGSYITFVDSDDYVHKDYCSVLFGLIKDSDIAIAGRAKYIDELFIKNKCPNKIEITTGCQAIKYLMLGTYSSRPAWGKLYTKDIISDITFEEHHIFEEIRFGVDTFSKAKKVIFSDKVLYYYMIRSGSIMTSNFDLQIDDLANSFDYIVNVLRNAGLYYECESEIKKWLIRIILRNARIYTKHNVDDMHYKKNLSRLLTTIDDLGGIQELYE